MTAVLLGSSDSPDRARMGGKADALARLGAAFPIPPWCVIPPEAFAGSTLTEVAQAALSAVLPTLGPGPYAVRSSAVEEDQAQHSFAGQLQSFLDVPAPQVVARVMAVRDSAYTDSVLAYRKLHGLTGAPPTPAVIVQQMVAAEAAGVAFSVDPSAADPTQLAIMAVAGLADRLVSGETTGDTYRWGRDLTLRAESWVGTAPVLSAAQQHKVAELALRAEQHFAIPQDIEWAFAHGQLYLLQSRPITTLQAGAHVLWDNSNIVESYSGVTTPLTFSFARYVYARVYQQFCRLLGVPEALIVRHAGVFANLLGYIDGHVYYHLLNWYRVLALLPGFTLNRRYMEQMMGVASALPEPLAQRLATEMVSGGRFRAGWRLLKSAWRLLGHAWGLQTTHAAFQQRLDRALAASEPPFAQRELTVLAQDYRNLEQALLNQWDAPLINDFLCMIAFGVSRALLLRWCGAAGAALHNDFLLGQGDIISAEPARRIRQMAALVRGDPVLVGALQEGDGAAAQAHPALAAALTDYLMQFGDRCTQELKLESLTLEEDPTPLLQAIGYAAQRPVSPPPAPTRSPELRLRAALAHRPLRYALARWWIARAKARVRDRENLRFQRTRLFGRVRRLFLAIGAQFAQAGLLATPRDIFYLEVDEVLGLIEGAATVAQPRALSALRRQEAELRATLPPPPARFWTQGAVCMETERRRAGAVAPTAEGDTRQGLGCAQGVAQAPVRLIHDPRQQSLHAGEILVALHTDPGWIALFSNAAGILVERGSLLSHSAIVAREMGIPAVVAVPGLMAWLQTGDRVVMDGSAGTVRKLAASAAEADAC